MSREKKIIIVTISIICFLLTMIIFMQFKVVNEREETNIETLNEAELREALLNWKTKYEETKQKYEEVVNSIKTYKEEKNSDKKTKETLEAELENLEMALGKTDVEGEGIIITLTENEPIVEAIDLICIVNYLKDAGAEAISINDERVVSTTDIVDLNDELVKKINSRFIRDKEYIIKAIGNKAYLESCISGKGGYQSILMAYGVNVDVQKSNKVTIQKYNGDFETKYLKEEE